MEKRRTRVGPRFPTLVTGRRRVPCREDNSSGRGGGTWTWLLRGDLGETVPSGLSRRSSGGGQAVWLFYPM